MSRLAKIAVAINTGQGAVDPQVFGAIPYGVTHDDIEPGGGLALPNLRLLQ